jgi:hypothetical protein
MEVRIPPFLLKEILRLRSGRRQKFKANLMRLPTSVVHSAAKFADKKMSFVEHPMPSGLAQ